MKKYLLIILLLFIVNSNAIAVSNRDILTSIENGMFGYDYKNETDNQRIERLEEYIYGEKKTGSVQNRIEALQNDSGISIVEEKKKKKSEKILLKDNMKNKDNPNLKEDETVEYAIVDKMEKDLFNQTFKNENIYDRLNRLETTVFQKTSNDNLSSRVDKLASVLRPGGRRVPMSETVDEKTLQELYKNSGLQQVDEQSLPFQLAALENDVLKHDYTGDNNANRLSRLEQKLFNRTYPNDADVQRLQRVLVAYEAKKDSYKYENNKRMQNMATISQIGGILLMILAILL